MSLSSAESNADGNADDNANDIDNGIPMNNIAVIEDFKEQSTEEHMLHHPVNPRSLVQCRTTVNDEHYNIFPFHCLPYTDLRPEACCFHGCVIDIWGYKVLLNAKNSLMIVGTPANIHYYSPYQRNDSAMALKWQIQN